MKIEHIKTFKDGKLNDEYFIVVKEGPYSWTWRLTFNEAKELKKLLEKKLENNE